MKVQLKADEERWVKLRWAKIREAQQVADGAFAKVKRISETLDRQLDARRVEDEIQRSKIKGESIHLKAAVDDLDMYTAEVQRHISDLHVFLKMKEMGVL